MLGGLRPLLRGYYYLAPLWYLVESTLWPGLRAGLLVGDSAPARAAFYAVEAAIGAGLWRGSNIADKAAFAENLLCLLNGMRFILIGPLEVALQAESPRFYELSEAYARAAPGMILSLLYVVHQVYARLYGGAPAATRPAPPGR